jgi:cell division control protein 6
MNVGGLMTTFDEILSKPSVFADRNVLSPHYLPQMLPFREKEIERVMQWLAPALRSQRPANIFIYGKTGTGKTSSVKHVVKKLEEVFAKRDASQKQGGTGIGASGVVAGKNGSGTGVAKVCYVNCKIYNSRYRVLQRITKEFLPEMDKMGFGLSTLYEKVTEWIAKGKVGLIVILDEVDMVRDLDDLMYTMTRANDELSDGSISVIGISNKLNFKDALGPRSKSSLLENEIIFPPYLAPQLSAILHQRIAAGFAKDTVSEGAVNLAAAIAAQETGDARYALRLLVKAGEIADEKCVLHVSDKEVEDARRSVDTDLAVETISTLPEHQQIVMFAACCLALSTSRYANLSGNQQKQDEDGKFMLSGEVYEEYLSACRNFGRKRRSARWYREYLHDLEMLGMITMVESGKGIRGHTRLIKVGYAPEKLKPILEKSLSQHRAEAEQAQLM